MSTINSNIEKGDTRFWSVLDDPKGDEDNPPGRIVAIPIQLKEQGSNLARGVIVAVKKIDSGEFLISDVEAAKSYNNLAARIIDIAG